MTSDGFVLSPTQIFFGLNVDREHSSGLLPGRKRQSGRVRNHGPYGNANRYFTEHASIFMQNLIAIRAEKRLALITIRFGSFISGTFSTSP
jgi:hypothetical protein